MGSYSTTLIVSIVCEWYGEGVLVKNEMDTSCGTGSVKYRLTSLREQDAKTIRIEAAAQSREVPSDTQAVYAGGFTRKRGELVQVSFWAHWHQEIYICTPCKKQ
jgi:hypothetical protein